MSLDALALPFGRQRADLGRGVGRVADRHAAYGLGERAGHLVVAGARGEDPGLRDARLAVVHQRGELQPAHRGIEVGVVTDDRGRLAAELQRAALELITADPADPAAGRCGAGERDLVHARMPYEVLAGLPAGRHDADHAARNARLGQHLGERVGVQRRLGSGLDHDGAPGDECGGELERDDELRDVPRRDRRDHPDRAARGVARRGRRESRSATPRTSPGAGRGAFVTWRARVRLARSRSATDVEGSESAPGVGDGAGGVGSEVGDHAELLAQMEHGHAGSPAGW